MSVSITGRHVAVTPALRRYVESKADRLDRFGLELHTVQVIIAVEKFRHSAEVLCVFNRRQYRAKASSSEMYASIDLVMDKIERQLREKKARLVNHKGKARRRLVVAALEPTPPPRPSLQIVRPIVPTLALDEAIAMLEADPDSPVVFVDGETQEMSVLRRSTEGRAELLVPRRRRSRGAG